MDFSMPRPRINGEMFPDFQSKSVTVLGIATEVLIAQTVLLFLGGCIYSVCCGTGILSYPSSET